jgi:hypothetical protein
MLNFKIAFICFGIVSVVLCCEKHNNEKKNCRWIYECSEHNQQDQTQCLKWSEHRSICAETSENVIFNKHEEASLDGTVDDEKIVATTTAGPLIATFSRIFTHHLSAVCKSGYKPDKTGVCRPVF